MNMDPRMRAAARHEDGNGHRSARMGLTRDLLDGLSPDEFSGEARALQDAKTLTPEVRERLKQRLVEHLKASVDTPTWGPDWVLRRAKRPRTNLRFSWRRRREPQPAKSALPTQEQSDSKIIVRNLEHSRQVAQYWPLYLGAAILAVVIVSLAMYVDYQIISGDIWMRALADEFMVVPESLRSSVAFKSLQVIFAALAMHFMLKITGVYGRNTLISTAFVLTVVMVGCLGYLVAYNNMGAATSVQRFNAVASMDQPSTIDALFASLGEPAAPQAGETLVRAEVAAAEYVLPLPRLSEEALANVDSWLWLAFASVIFFIVTAIGALYIQVAEQNIRNFVIARDYHARRKQYAQLNLLELARCDGAAPAD